MFKIFSKAAGLLKAESEAGDAPVWLRDPLSHPDIAAMDARTLGDLPFGLFRVPDLCTEAPPQDRRRAA